MKSTAAAVAAALEDVFAGRNPRLTLEEMQAAHAAFQSGRNRKAEPAGGGQSSRAGQAFLASNAENEGVMQAADGLQYRILRAAEGTMPVARRSGCRALPGPTARRQRSSTAPTGAESRPSSCSAAVIPGWQAALQLMTVGSHWEVWIPAALAYGEQGAGGSIGPNQTLHFEIELLEIKPRG